MNYFIYSTFRLDYQKIYFYLRNLDFVALYIDGFKSSLTSLNLLSIQYTVFLCV